MGVQAIFMGWSAALPIPPTFQEDGKATGKANLAAAVALSFVARLRGSRLRFAPNLTMRATEGRAGAGMLEYCLLRGRVGL